MIKLPINDVHAWYADLELSRPRLSELERTLAPDERERAARFRFEHHRQRFIAGRGLLRAILAAYLATEPANIRLSCSAQGKPCLADRHGSLRFNLSHAHQLAVYAVTQGREVGVDVEWVRPLEDMMAIAERCFSARETTILKELAGVEQQWAFFRAWTRKEAWAKATGRGLEFPPERVEVNLSEEEPARLLSVKGNHGEAGHWSLQDLPVPPGYMATLAAAGQIGRCPCRPWPSGATLASGRINERGRGDSPK